MYQELEIVTSTQKHKAFFMDGFHLESIPTTNLHNHNFSEVHLLAKGNADFMIGGKTYTLSQGSIMIIPRGVFHCCIKCDKDTHHNAFQIDYETDSVKTLVIGKETIQSFFDEIALTNTTKNYYKIASYISLFCSHIHNESSLHTSNVTDYGFIIWEFLSLHYNEDLHVSDLAKELHLSERQTERLMKEYTGKSFKNELCEIRMNIAKHLIDNSELSLSEIARYVGYDSYAGFWKAMKKYNL